MEKECKMDCHACTLQDGFENKALCSALLMPAMINELKAQIKSFGVQIQEFGTQLQKIEQKKPKLNDIKPKKYESNNKTGEDED